MDIAKLGKQLDSADTDVCQKAAETLSQNAEVAAEVAAQLVAHSGDDDRVVAEYCVAALEELGPPAASALVALADLTQSSSTDVAYWAATLLGRSGDLAAEHARQLGKLVASDADPIVRERAAWALGRIGPAAKAAKPQLEVVAKKEPKNVARAASKAIQAIG